MKKSKYGMPPPSTRAEFEHNIGLSFEDALRKLKRKQLDSFFVQRTLPQLKDIEFLPNGRINFNSVDESLRLQANMQHWMELMPPPEIIQKEGKKISRALVSEVRILKNKVDNKKKHNKGKKRTNKKIVEHWQNKKRSKHTRIKRRRKK